MNSKFAVGQRVEVTRLDPNDPPHGIKIGWKGVVTDHSEYGNPYVKFDNDTTEGVGYGKRGDSILMFNNQLIESADVGQSPTDHLSAVSAATLDYQRLLREYKEATAAENKADDAQRLAAELRRNTGAALKKAKTALDAAHHAAAGVEFKP